MSITVETASPCLDVPIAPAQPGGSPVIEIVIGSAIVRIAVGTDAATLQTVLRARRCLKLTACVIFLRQLQSQFGWRSEKLDPEQRTPYEKTMRAWTDRPLSARPDRTAGRVPQSEHPAVISLMPSSRSTCLFNILRTASAMTSRLHRLMWHRS